jgi:hypothetical protein
VYRYPGFEPRVKVSLKVKQVPPTGFFPSLIALVKVSLKVRQVPDLRFAPSKKSDNFAIEMISINDIRRDGGDRPVTYGPERIGTMSLFRTGRIFLKYRPG